MRLRKADTNDVNLLIKLRLDYLNADGRTPSEEEKEKIKKHLQEYFLTKLISNECICVLAEIENYVVGTAWMTISERPASPVFITGKIGTIINVLTYPKFRRRGIAKNILNALIQEAKNQDISLIELTSTKDGEFLYNSLGFEKIDRTFMRLKLN